MSHIRSIENQVVESYERIMEREIELSYPHSRTQADTQGRTGNGLPPKVWLRPKEDKSLAIKEKSRSPVKTDVLKEVQSRHSS